MGCVTIENKSDTLCDTIDTVFNALWVPLVLSPNLKLEVGTCENFQGVLTTMPPGPSIQCQPVSEGKIQLSMDLSPDQLHINVSTQVGITPRGGHLLGPATGRPLPWL